jgi:MoaA/NifB/PqqE/SkfB family radical SAM enzyme
MNVGPHMYRVVADREEAKAIFASSVERVEIETHSYCNRRCDYCPNVIGDRLGANVQMPEDIWQTVVGDLAEIRYHGKVVLNYYNEPLADRAILDRIRELRSKLPKAHIMIYSNGDYLEPGYVDELADAGLNYLHVSIHLKRGDRYTDLYVVNRMIEIAVRMGLPAKIEAVVSQEYILARAAHPKLKIDLRGINFLKHGTDRGGLIEDIHTAEKRSAPCHFPYAHFVIGYNGTIVPCCHIRGDRPEHAGLTYGNLRNYGSIYQAFLSQKAAEWRGEMGSDRVKRSPCDTCSAGILDTPEQRNAFAKAYRIHGPKPPATATVE